MKTQFFLVMFAALTAIAGPVTTSAQAEAGREKLGFRIGYVEARGNIDTNFGDGSVLAVHFTERIIPPLFIDISLGALYLGAANVDTIWAQGYSSYIGDADMRILFISLAPALEFPITGSSIFYVTGGIGLYSISVLLDRVYFGFDTSQERFGANGSAGLYYSISDNWKVNFNFTTHLLWTSAKPTDMFYFYSEGESDPRFYEFTVGATYSLN